MVFTALVIARVISRRRRRRRRRRCHRARRNRACAIERASERAPPRVREGKSEVATKWTGGGDPPSCARAGVRARERECYL